MNELSIAVQVRKVQGRIVDQQIKVDALRERLSGPSLGDDDRRRIAILLEIGESAQLEARRLVKEALDAPPVEAAVGELNEAVRA